MFANFEKDPLTIMEEGDYTTSIMHIFNRLMPLFPINKDYQLMQIG